MIFRKNNTEQKKEKSSNVSRLIAEIDKIRDDEIAETVVDHTVEVETKKGIEEQYSKLEEELKTKEESFKNQHLEIVKNQQLHQDLQNKYDSLMAKYHLIDNNEKQLNTTVTKQKVELDQTLQINKKQKGELERALEEVKALHKQINVEKQLTEQIKAEQFILETKEKQIEEKAQQKEKALEKLTQKYSQETAKLAQKNQMLRIRFKQIKNEERLRLQKIQAKEKWEEQKVLQCKAEVFDLMKRINLDYPSADQVENAKAIIKESEEQQNEILKQAKLEAKTIVSQAHIESEELKKIASSKIKGYYDELEDYAQRLTQLQEKLENNASK